MTRERISPKQEMIQVRIHKDIRTRAELLLEWVAGNAELSPSGSAELTDVYRAALCLGLEQLESKRRRELNENPDPPEDLVENPDPPEDQDEEVDPMEGLSALQKLFRENKLAENVSRAIFLAPEATLASMFPKDQAEEVDRAAVTRTEYSRRNRYTAIHPVDAVLKDVIENLDPPKHLVENPDSLEDQAEEVDPRQGLSTFQRQLLKMKEAEERTKLVGEGS